jgi:uncharacterized tellurite resistance protein B-like protein
MSIFSLFSSKQQTESSDVKNYNSIFNRIKNHVKDLSENEIRFIAAFSGLLGRIAYADLNISEEEVKRIEKILAKTTSLSESEISAVIDVMFSEIKSLVGLENHLYTQEINEIASKEKKEELLIALFLVASADKDISSEENEELRKTAKALGIGHNEYILIRSKFKDYLSILKK